MRTMTETILVGFAGLLTLAVTAICARIPRRKWVGVLAGIVTGGCLSYLLGAAIGFAKYILPFNQTDFWIAAQLARIGL